MHGLAWPPSARITAWTIAPVAHSRGGKGAGGHYSYGIGGGAMIGGAITVAPMANADALDLRGLLHGLRGRAGSLALRMPSAVQPSEVAAQPRAYGRVIYTDGSDHTDGSGYAGPWGLARVDLDGTAVVGSGLTAGGFQASLTGVVNSAVLTAGAWVAFGNALSGGQLVQVVDYTAPLLTFRPRLRAAVASGTRLTIGRPYGLFRLAGDTPAIPILADRSLSFQVALEEYWLPSGVATPGSGGGGGGGTAD